MDFNEVKYNGYGSIIGDISRIISLKDRDDRTGFSNDRNGTFIKGAFKKNVIE